MISLKSKRELDLMREAGRIHAGVLKSLKKYVRPGLTTKDIDKKAGELILAQPGAEVAFKGYRGFPGNICISVNEEVVHGIPSDRKLKEGDVISVDVGVKLKGYYTDAARTWPVGEVSPEIQKMIWVTKASFREAALPQIKIDNRIGDVSHAIQVFVEKRGFGVVRDFVGHGIGKQLHEEPQVPNYGTPGRGIKIEEGLVIAIEPMVTLGDYEVMILEDNWTVVTCDGKYACHHEDTVAVTDKGPEILTAWEGEEEEDNG